MNLGFFGFPNSSNPGGIISVAQFDSSGSYQIPTGSKLLYIFAIGGGGGGCAGTVTGNNVVGAPGWGGGSGNYGYFLVDVESIGGPQTLDIFIGAGGAGQAAGTTGIQAGLGSSPGGITAITTSTGGDLIYLINSNEVFMQATPLINITPSAFLFSTDLVQNQGFQTTNTAITVSSITNCGGGHAGTVSAGNVPTAGYTTVKDLSTSTFFSVPFTTFGGTILQGGITGTATTSGGTGADSTFQIFGAFTPGVGGVGGGGTTFGNGGTGGMGYRGSGGGGGGACRPPYKSGAGGTGGNGYVAIVALR